jgi:hypothetical protein
MDAFFEKISALQKKPVHVRRQILFVTTGVLCALVFFFWLSILPVTISRVEARISGATTSNVSPFSSLAGVFHEAENSLSFVGKMVESQARYVREQASTTTRIVLVSTMDTVASTTLSTTTPNEASE